MATIAEVVRRRDLELYELPEWERALPIRPLFVAPALWRTIDDNAKFYDGSLLIGARTPDEHLAAFFTDLRCAKPVGTTEFRRMKPTSDCVWAWHPPGLRVFGWICAPWTFVAVSVALERDVKAEPQLYEEHQNGVLSFIHRHELGGAVLRGDAREAFPRPERR